MTDNDWTAMGITDKQPWEVAQEMPSPEPGAAKRAQPEFLEVTTHKFKSNIDRKSVV